MLYSKDGVFLAESKAKKLKNMQPLFNKQISKLIDSRIMRGIALMLCAVFFFSLVGVIAKFIAAQYPPNEIAFFRMLFGLIPAMLVFRRLEFNKKEFTLSRFGGHFLRAAMALGSMGTFLSSLLYLPLSTAVTLHYLETIFVAVFAVVCLGERLRMGVLGGLIVGLGGVTLISPLTGGYASVLGTGLGVLSAVFGAGAVIQIKRLSRTEEPTVIVLYFTLIGTIVSGLSLWVSWTTPSMEDLALMALLGLTAGTGQLLLTTAFKNAPASLLAPLSYFGVVWSILFEYVIWGELIGLQAALGAVLIVGSALCVSLSGRRIDSYARTSTARSAHQLAKKSV
ncbi:Transporter, drug/metabolite exporter family [Mycetohabitans rhizoxinica HKI 454]|uniref:Transporter, drug/metabolite exporter family n=2 Tax=Mycetohabitans rhizoxinica TaxID=412963 RepID=E5AND6_MYCRK|nr:DMT family transporter [Mycetohabitans sp. B6]MCG1045885.1 DMT family transporter [Mycetohabitans sp. B6]CBW76389.1 Transporter, drug/metabolite exporter family [Mycetohabitans rhizoxinica HKI 454]